MNLCHRPAGLSTAIVGKPHYFAPEVKPWSEELAGAILAATS